jgi:RNA polymerase primary sigma factor
MRQPESNAEQQPWEQERERLPRGGAEVLSYLNQLTRHRLLTCDEETQLSARVQKGDARAKDRLVEANMRLVINIARRYHHPLIPLEDLIQEGAIGLMIAAERFDPRKGFRFSTFATLWIKKAISGAIDNKAKAIRLPGHVAGALRKLDKARLLLAIEQGEEPSLEQIAARLEVSTTQLQALMQIGQEPISLDMLVGEEGGATLASLLDDRSAVNPQDVVLSRERHDELNQLLAILSPDELAIMCKGLGFHSVADHRSQLDGEKRRLSRERVRQIEIQALRKLKTAARRRELYV